jgi:Regulator of chromosome condensation (RCC1) repeat
MRKNIAGGRLVVVSQARSPQSAARAFAKLRRRLLDLMVVLAGMVMVSVAATAGTTGPVRAWYYDMYGNVLEDCATVPYGAPCGWLPGGGGYGTPLPADLGRCKRVAVGGGHFAAITTANQLRMWGNNDRGQTTVPSYIDTVSRVALGESHTLIVASDGFVTGWGNNDQGQLNAPFNLGTCTEIAAGSYHSLAIRTNGTVRAWGWNAWQQTNVPSDLGTCTQVAAGEYHSLALRSDGVVRAWGEQSPWMPGLPDCGQTDINGVTNASTIAAASRSSHALVGNPATSSTLRGCTQCGQSLPYYDAGYRGLAATSQQVIGVTLDGRLRGTGRVGPWQCGTMSDWQFPAGIGRCVTVAGREIGGTSVFIAIQDDDCDSNGFADADDIIAGRGLDLNTNARLDSCEIADGVERDCNGDGRIDSYQIENDEVLDLNNNMAPDACDIAAGWEEDCDLNGVIDSVQQGQNVMFAVESQQVGPIGYTSPRSVELAAPPYTLGGVQLQVTAFGDFSSSSEYLKLYLNGRWVGEVLTMTADWMAPKNDCSQPTRGWLYIPRDFFNETIKSSGSTSAVFEVVPSIAVNANQCPTGSWVKVSLSYEAAITGDCNANGLLDVCEVRDFPEFDGNSNGIIDACENYTLVFECPGDLDGSGDVTTGDISILLMNFGLAMPGDPNDIDASGTIDTADISLLLLSFGDC